MSGRPKLPLTESHEIFRGSARRFFETECAPFQGVWEKEGVPRALWKRAGELGFLCPRVAEEQGGLGADFLYSVILVEEQARAGVVLPDFSRHSDTGASYLAAYGTDAQTALLPQMASGTALGASAIGNRIVARRDGSDFVLDGRADLVVNGREADIILVGAQTGDSTSIYLIELGKADDIVRSQPMKTLGRAAAGAVDLVFKGVHVRASSLLGGREGQGTAQIAALASEERLLQAAASIATIERALRITIEYVKERRAFKQRIVDFQNTRFKLAEARTEAVVLRIFLERCLREFLAGRLKAGDAAALAYAAADKQCAIIDDCVQLHGGYGYILDYPIARMWTECRLAKILTCTDATTRAIMT